MEKSIYILDPKDIPYGPLSNNYEYYFELDGKKWKSVTNYILSNMLKTPIYRLTLEIANPNFNSKQDSIKSDLQKTIKNIELRKGMKLNKQEINKIKEQIKYETEYNNMNIFEMYRYFVEQESIFTLMKKGIENGYTSRLKQNPKLLKKILSSGDNPILYYSFDNLIGIDPNTKKGSNLIGNILMQIRHKLRLEEKFNIQKNIKQEEDENIFKAYIAYNILNYEISNDLDIDLYLGKNSEQIIEIFKDKYKIFSNPLGITKDYLPSIKNSYEKDEIPFIKDEIQIPGSMSYSLRNEKYIEIKLRNKNKREFLIFNSYVKYILKRAYKNEDKESIKFNVKNLIKAAPSINEYIKLKDRIIKMYNQKQLPLKLLNKIKDKLKYFPEITIPNQPVENKDILIETLIEYTGKNFEEYKNYTKDELLQKIKNIKNLKQEGYWDIIIKHDNNENELLQRLKGKRPSKRTIQKYLDEYNKINNTSIEFKNIKIDIVEFNEIDLLYNQNDKVYNNIEENA